MWSWWLDLAQHSRPFPRPNLQNVLLPLASASVECCLHRIRLNFMSMWTFRFACLGGCSEEGEKHANIRQPFNEPPPYFQHNDDSPRWKRSSRSSMSEGCRLRVTPQSVQSFVIQTKSARLLWFGMGHKGGPMVQCSLRRVLWMAVAGSLEIFQNGLPFPEAESANTGK